MDSLNSRIQNIAKRRSETLLELEDQKLFATTSQRVVLDEEIRRLDEKYQAQLDEMKILQAKGWAEMGSQEKLAGIVYLLF